jgi:hypothetical protein
MSYTTFLNYVRITKYMKAYIVKFLLISVMVGVLSSCANTKRDCQGHIKHKQSNGVWI